MVSAFKFWVVLACTFFGCASSAADVDVHQVLDAGDVDVHQVLAGPDVSECRWDHTQLWHRECCAHEECVAHGDPGVPETSCVASPASSRTTCQQKCASDGSCPSGLSCVEDGYCWFLCGPGVPYGCPGSLECVPHGTYVAGPVFVCKGERL